MKKTINVNSAPRQSRRRVLKTAVLGGAAAAAAPDKWTRPIVDSVLLPAHATTTDTTGSDPVFNVRGGKGAIELNESFPDIILPPAESEIEQAAAQAMNLSDLFVSSAHAADISLNFVTRYFLENTDGSNYRFTSLRIFEASQNRWFAEGMLTVGNTTGCPTYLNCNQRMYTKSVTLNSVTETEAVVTIDFAGVFSYTKTIPLNLNVSADTC